MKKFKSFLLAIPLTILAVLSISFVGCKDKPSNEFTFMANNQIKADADNVINSLKTKVYNNSELGTGWQEERKTTFTLAEVNQKLGEELGYYVQLGTLSNAPEIIKLTFKDVSFTKDQNVAVSIGLNNKIVDKAYYVKDSKLYVAAPIVAFETLANTKIKLNDKEFSLNLTEYNNTINATGVVGKQGSTITVSENGYNVGVSNPYTMLGINIQGLDTNDFMVTRKVFDGKLNSYGLTGVDQIDGSDYYGVYPLTKTQFNNLTVGKSMVQDYSIYVINRGISSIKLILSSIAAE